MILEKVNKDEDKAYMRHLKRYVHAPEHRFAAITPPELAELCREELEGLGIEGAEVTEAGVEFGGKLSESYRANLWLRTASRVLMRLPSFRAGIVEELFHKAAEIRWELWLSPALPLRVDAFVEHSRIEHEGTVEDAIFSAVKKRFRVVGMPVPGVSSKEPSDKDGEGETAPSSSPVQRLLVHLRSNHCEISLDMTGAHLHQRGYRLGHSGAPLRETLAAAILRKSGWRGESSLVDGMSGAGTFAIEAALIARRLPPGLKRPFLFERWPGFQEKTWQYLRRHVLEQSLAQSPVPVVAIDQDGRAVDIARQNAGRAGVEEDIRWECQDFFDFKPKLQGISPGLLVLNPPYGKRLSGGGGPLFERLGPHLREHYKGWRAAILVPNRALATGLRAGAMRFWNITHGGIPIVVAMARL